MKYLKNSKVISFLSNKVKLTVIGCCIVLISCSSNDDEPAVVNCGSGAWTQSVQTELNNWLTAIQVYGETPTIANCENYKTAILAYINALDKIKDCVPTESLLNFEQAIEEANLEIATIDCSDN